MTTAIERLETLLNEKELEIESLTKKVSDLEDSSAQDWSWARHHIFKDDPSPELPLPRLEIRWTHLDDDCWNLKAIYSIVHPHFSGQVVFVPLGMTRVGGGGSVSREPGTNRLALPIRDGAHIRHDMEVFDLPGYVVYKDEFRKIED